MICQTEIGVVYVHDRDKLCIYMAQCVRTNGIVSDHSGANPENVEPEAQTL